MIPFTDEQRKKEAILNGFTWCQLVAIMTVVRLLIISRAFFFSFKKAERRSPTFAIFIKADF